MRREMRSRDFKDGTRVEHRKIGKKIGGKVERTVRSMEWKEENLLRVDCDGGGRLRDLEVRNISQENSKGREKDKQRRSLYGTPFVLWGIEEKS